MSLLAAESDIQVLIPMGRADDTASVEKDLECMKPTHVVSFIGRTHGTIGTREYPTIDYLEQSGKLPENLRDNLFAPITLAAACQRERNTLYISWNGLYFRL